MKIRRLNSPNSYENGPNVNLTSLCQNMGLEIEPASIGDQNREYNVASVINIFRSGSVVGHTW